MTEDWLVVDTHFLFHRAFHSNGHGDVDATVRAVFRCVDDLTDLYSPAGIAWAFDRPPYNRTKLYPGYKDGRDKTSRDELHTAIVRLRDYTLSGLGFRNVLSQVGMEADDVMASAVLGLGENQRAVLVSRDADLYQLLSVNCAVHNPVGGKFITVRSFREEYGIAPRLWSEVKAISGCTSDKVPGLRGVKQDDAVRFFRNELKGTPKHDKILAYNRSPEYALARKLVTLPLEGTEEVTLVKDGIVRIDRQRAEEVWNRKGKFNVLS